MATIVQILPRRWPGRTWSIQGDDYATLTWDIINPEAKPAEVDIRDQSDSVDAEIVIEVRKAKQQDQLSSDNIDAILLGFEIMVDAIFEIGSKLKPASLTSPLDATVVARMQAMRTRIQELRSIV